MKYIIKTILNWVSIFLSLFRSKFKLVNKAELHALKVKAKKFLGKEMKITFQGFKGKERITQCKFVDFEIYAFTEDGVKDIKGRVSAIMKEIDNDKIHTLPLIEIIEEFERLENIIS